MVSKFLKGCLAKHANIDKLKLKEKKKGLGCV
jgi:hypothetical protein